MIITYAYGTCLHTTLYQTSFSSSNSYLVLLQSSCYTFTDHSTEGIFLVWTILALPGPNSTTVLGPAKEPAKSRLGHCDLNSPQPINCHAVWNASPQLLIHDHLPFSSSVILKDRVQNSRSWRSQVKSTNQIMRDQGNTGYTQRHHNQASRIFNMIGWW